MKFGKVRLNASVIIALLAALYILMICREKYFIEYAEGEPVKEEVTDVVYAEDDLAEGGVAEGTAPVVTEETGGVAEPAPKEEGMSAGAIAGITAASIVALIAIMIVFMRFRRRY
tara:strand:- start:9 stop:353 length:345 start_codon:yes stop_codon:yes gene_type:complete